MTAGLRHLLDRVALIETRVRTLVQHRRGFDPAPDDPFRGLYVSDDVAGALLDPIPDPPSATEAPRQLVEDAADAAEARGEILRLRRLARTALLDDTDVELLLICLLPDLDPRFERLFGYLNDDVSRRRASVALALSVAGLSSFAAADRARLARGGPLIDNALVVVEDTERPLLTRGLRVPDRVTAHLLGDDAPDAVLAAVQTVVEPHESPSARDIETAIRAGERLIHVRAPYGSAGAEASVAALHAAGFAALVIDGERLGTSANASEVAFAACRDAALRNAGLVVTSVEAVAAGSRDAVTTLSAAATPVVFVGTGPWDPALCDDSPLVITVPRLTARQRLDLWSRAVPAELAGAVEQFAMGPTQIARAARAANAATVLGTPMSPDLLRRGARAQNAAGLERLARRIEPGVSWADLVLPEGPMRALRDLADRARHRDRVLTEWGMRRGGGRGRGVTALFAGESGTGKTMSAEVIAAELGLDLYAVNLATVIDKYIGETEKNLERIFTEADGVNAVLLFDEADAIFGKRSEVRDAHDRYANVESAYLLQRMETFDGLAVLATNLRANLDDAFTRRLDLIVEFPEPDATARLALWQRCLAPPVPCSADLDLDFFARTFTMSGGNIRSAAITAGYLAAADSAPVAVRHVVAAVAQEYRKLGRLLPERELSAHLTA